ncbi:MAG TPA: SGNH/GDSL hydrolase family protein [Pseudonocardiaceae bacterium]
MGTWHSFLAIGDSFTEGMNDADGAGGYRGWADRVAEQLAARSPGLRYANVAVRGRLLAGIVNDQVPVAERLRPDLITFAAGGNDILRPGCDVDRLADLARGAIGRLAATGAEVVVFTGFDPRGVLLIGRLRGLIAAYNELLRDAANQHGCRIVDLWAMRVLQDRRAWSEDRLHLTTEGHERVAMHVAEVLGLPVTADWREPWPADPPLPWPDARREDLRWARQYLLPWLRERARDRALRRPGGAGQLAKRPELAPFLDSAAEA